MLLRCFGLLWLILTGTCFALVGFCIALACFLACRTYLVFYLVPALKDRFSEQLPQQVLARFLPLCCCLSASLHKNATRTALRKGAACFTYLKCLANP